MHAKRIGSRPRQSGLSLGEMPRLVLDSSSVSLDPFEVAKHVLRVLHIEPISRWNPDDKPHFVRVLSATDQINDRTVGQHPAVIVLVSLPQTAIIYDSPVCRGILQHDNPITGEVNAKVLVGDTFSVIVARKKYVAGSTVAAKAEPHAQVVDIRR